MKKLAMIVAVVAGCSATAVVGVGRVNAQSACVNATVHVAAHGSDLVNQTVSQCAP
jgi:hypothetical protein